MTNPNFKKLLNQSSIQTPCRAYLSGIGGIGMSAIAFLLLDLGWKVGGTDLHKTDLVEKLIQKGIKFYKTHSAQNICAFQPDVVIYSSAIRKDNPEIIAAQERKTLLLKRAEVLASLMDMRKGISVAGMHGKTTTSASLAYALQKLNPSNGFAIGGEFRQLPTHAQMGVDEDVWFAAECDESDGTLVDFSPVHAIILNVDRDHMDHYQNEQDIEEVFLHFTDNVSGKIVCCADNEWLMRLREAHFKNKSITYGFCERSDFQVVLDKESPSGEQLFTVKHFGKLLGCFSTKLFGIHNVSNLTAVIALLTEIGYSAKEIAESIKDFVGTHRRMETLYDDGYIKIIDDYGHHPEEIKATIRALKKENKRLIVAFQPHRFSRTKCLIGEFSTCFKECDLLFLTDVYAASETPLEGVSGKIIADAVLAEGQSVNYIPKLDDVSEAVKDAAKSGDIILFLGAGSITQQAHLYAKNLKNKIY